MLARVFWVIRERSYKKSTTCPKGRRSVQSDRGANGGLRAAERASDGGRGSRVVPVGARGDDVVASDAASAEAEVRAAQGAGRRDDASVVASNAAIVADTAAGLAPQVPAERAERGVKLLEYHSLRLNVANLLRDDPVILIV